MLYRIVHGRADLECEGPTWIHALGDVLMRSGRDLQAPGLWVARVDGDGIEVTIGDEVFQVASLAEPTDDMDTEDTSTSGLDSTTLAEQLFNLSGTIASADRRDAYEQVLDLVLQWVSAEGISIVQATVNDPELRYVAARGPVAAQIVGQSLAYGEGIVGLCLDSRSTVRVGNAADSSHHASNVDQKTGYSTRSMLCVPVLDHDGQAYGAIQLVDSRVTRFTDRDVEVVETIAGTLAETMASH